MAKNFNEKLIEILKTDSRFVDDEGELVKAAVIDRAWKIDRNLVKLLLAAPDIKGKFFDEIEGHWIFNINTFIEYISEKNFLANSYTKFRNKIGLTIGGKFMRERAEVSLVWPYKDCVLEGGQTREEEKRKEIFFNEILAQDEINRLRDPKVLTNWKRYTTEGEQEVTEIKRDENGTIKENLIIKGNNLIALHTLEKQFRGKVKLIYIDPPYNTGNDSFGYNDNFNHSSWLTFMKNRLEVAKQLLREDGVIFVQIDHHELGYINLLLDEIFGIQNKVQIISVKVASPSGFKAVNPGPIDVTEYILFYTKNKPFFNFKRNYVPAKYHPNYNLFIGNRDQDVSEWKFIPIKKKVLELNGFNNEKEAKEKFGEMYSSVMENMIAEFAFKHPDEVVSIRDLHKPTEKVRKLQIESREDGGNIRIYKKTDGSNMYLYKGGALAFYSSKIKNIDGKPQVIELLSDFWEHISWAGIAREGNVTLKNGKKPEKLIKQILEIATDVNDIVLDYHLGSGTTCSVSHKMGRHYIGIEQLNYGKDDSTERLQNVIGGKKKTKGEMFHRLEYDTGGISKSVNWQGGGDFIYCELMKYNEAYMDKIQAAKSSAELVDLWKDIAKNSFLNWYVNHEMPEDAVDDFIEIGKTENGLEKQKNLLAELLDKNQLYVNLSEIADEDFRIKEDDKKLNRSFYGDEYDNR